jgi:hypothetical protein
MTQWGAEKMTNNFFYWYALWVLICIGFMLVSCKLDNIYKKIVDIETAIEDKKDE